MCKKLLVISLLVIAFSVLGFNFVNQVARADQKESCTQVQDNLDTQLMSKAHDKKVLIVYFSHSGNTRKIAEKVRTSTWAHIMELKTVNKYPKDYKAVVKQAREELAADARPKLVHRINNFDDYDIIILAYPNWCNTMPMPVFTFLQQYDFKGKTIAPLCTYGSGGFGNSLKDMAKLVPKAKITEGFGIRGADVEKSDADLRAWLKDISVLEDKNI